MSVYLGDFPAGGTVYIPWDSFAAATGAPSAASNFAAGDIKIYKNGGTTERSSSNGITVTTSFDSHTGVQMVVIDLSENTDAGFYAAGNEYQVIVADVTIDSQTVRFVLATFSIERANGILALIKHATNGLSAISAKLPALVSGRVDASVGAYQSGQAPLQPTTAGRTLDVSAGGEAGLDWANIGSPSAMVGLAGTTVKQVTDVDTKLGSPASASVSADIAAVKGETATLLTRLTASRAGYLDNLNVGGAVASQADITALNQSASRRIILTSVEQFERPESGTVDYVIEARTFDGDGALVNADSTPTLAATGIVSGDLAANLSVASNPSTGVYRWTYTVLAAAVAEQIRFDVSAVLSASTFTLPLYAQVVDVVASTWTSADRTKLTAIYDRTPGSGTIAVVTDIPTAVQVAAATRDVSNGSPAAGSLGEAVKKSADRMPSNGTLPTTADVPTAAQNAAATRDVANTGPAANSLGAGVKALSDRAPGSGTLAVQGDILPAATVASAVRTELSTELGRLDVTLSTRAATGAAMTLTVGERTAIAQAVLGATIEGSITLVQAVRGFMAALYGKVSGAQTNNPGFRDTGDTKTRITAVTDENGNRSSVTLDLS